MSYSQGGSGDTRTGLYRGSQKVQALGQECKRRWKLP